jgi:uncharacterized protein (UPF0548 family)
MFDMPWVLLSKPEAPIETGKTVAVAIRFAGLWWPNACRIVYVVDEISQKKFGFAYGTLLDHNERGEERFLVEMLPDGSVCGSRFARSRVQLIYLAGVLIRSCEWRNGDSFRKLMRPC